MDVGNGDGRCDKVGDDGVGGVWTVIMVIMALVVVVAVKMVMVSVGTANLFVSGLEKDDEKKRYSWCCRPMLFVMANSFIYLLDGDVNRGSNSSSKNYKKEGSRGRFMNSRIHFYYNRKFRLVPFMMYYSATGIKLDYY